MSENNLLLILALAAFIQLVMLFAQVKLFEINSTLKDIRRIAEKVSENQRA